VELGVGATMYLCRIPLRRSVSSISLRLSKRAGTSTASSPANWSMVRTSATEQSRFDHNLKTPRKKIFIQMSIFSQCCFWFIFCSVHVLTLVSTLFCPSVLFLSRCITVHDGVCLILMALDGLLYVLRYQWRLFGWATTVLLLHRLWIFAVGNGCDNNRDNFLCRWWWSSLTTSSGAIGT
jgi:hypothetical protein